MAVKRHIIILNEQRKYPISISVDSELLTRIDIHRGRTSRSQFVREVLINWLDDKRRVKP